MTNRLSTRTRIFVVTLALLLGPLFLAYWHLHGRTVAEVRPWERASLESQARLVAEVVAQRRLQPTDERGCQRVVQLLATSSGSEVTLFSRGGDVVATSASTLPAVGAEVAEAQARGLSLSTRVVEGREHLVVAVPWTSAGAVVGVVRLVASSPAAAESEQLDGRLLGGSLLALMLAVLVAFASTHLASRKARAFTAVATKMADGDLSVRTNAQGNDELAVLGRALDALAESLSDTLRQLRSERNRLSRVLASMSEGVLLVDAGGTVQLVNNALMEMLYLAPNPEGEPVSSVIEYEELSELLALVAAGESQSAELRLAKLKGRTLLAGVRGLSDGGVLAVLVDITEQRRLETVRQEFVANASHELRTPIAAIISAAETLEGVWGPKQEGATFLDMISRNAQRLKTLVDDLLSLSHLESGTIELDIQPLRLRPILESIMNDFTPAAREKKTELFCLVPSDVVALASQRGLQHVIGNLVDNAIKYSPPGSKVRVSVQRKDDAAVVSVSDDGPGIPAEHRSRIFERFYRVDAGRSRALGGTGLGLSIVKHWVEAMSGTIRVADAEPHGTTFSVQLELASEQAASRESAR